ncbi:MAG: ATP-binding protein [Actinomycetota bacterium]
MAEEPLHRAIFAVDIEGFGRPDRTDWTRVRLRKRLNQLIDHALGVAEIPSRQLSLRKVLGDGLLLVFDPYVSIARLLHPLIARLAAGLADHNRAVPGAERMRLRLAIHEGQLLPDAYDYVGESLNHTFRLLDAEAVREVLRRAPRADLVLVVSDSIRQDIIAHGYPGVEPTGFQPVRVHAKETRTRAWVHLPGLREQPRLPEVLVASPVGPETLPIPRELPADIYAFTGRGAEIAGLESLAPPRDSSSPSPVVISVIAGAAGVGKTALAVHWAHRIKDRFPDGQLYVNLHGYEPRQRLSPAQVLDRFLRALGVAAEALPTNLEEQAARYRALLADKRVLVVLDNASFEDQVRLLLPGNAACFVLITSRDSLAGLVAAEGGRPFALDVLAPKEAVELLHRIGGRARMAAEAEAAAEIARLCGCLPLAVRIAGAKLVTRPAMSVAELARRLGDEQHRLGELAAGDIEVRASFALSYAGLGPAEARMFRRLGLIAGPDFGVGAAAALIDAHPEEAKVLLEHLGDAHLIEDALLQGRYRFHDLLRLYARERVQAEETDAARETALRGVLEWYLNTAEGAERILWPHRRPLPRDRAGECSGPAFTTRTQARAWFEAERAGLVAAVRQAGVHCGFRPFTWQLADALWGFFYLRKRWVDWQDSHEVALAATREAHDRQAEAWILHTLGAAYRHLRRFDEAIGSLEQSLAICRETGDRQGEAQALAGLGSTYFRLGRFDEAISCSSRARGIYREIGYRLGETQALDALGAAYRHLRRFDEAIGSLEQSLAICREIGERWVEAVTLHILGNTHRDLALLEEAIDYYRAALAICREIEDRWGEARNLHLLGLVLEHTRGMDAARARWREALEIFTELGASEADKIRALLEDR